MESSSVASLSSPSTPRKRFDVFLSFKGEVRERFLSHLIEKLDNKNHALKFYDKENLTYSQDLKEELEKAIKASHIAIMVFSEGYADSSWCLDEMVMIMKRRNDDGMFVIPVFLEVEPWMIRTCDLTTTYGRALEKHGREGTDEKIVDTWRKHLTSVPSKCGEDVQRSGRSEAAIVKRVSQFVNEKLAIYYKTCEKLVGIESRARQMVMLIKQSNETLFLGIHGTGGLGKTTLARYVYDEFKSDEKFEASYILDVGPTTNLVELQRTLLSQLLEVDVHVANKEDGTARISRNLGGIRVLLVLDNAMDDEHLSALARKKDWFGEGSVIIVTTRDADLLHEQYRRFGVALLSPQESMELFCQNAFNEDKPRKGYEELSTSFVSYASGLPKALQVIGYHLRSKTKGQWISLRDGLPEMPEEFDEKIFSVLRISYDGLTLSQRKIFLDIACFFRGNPIKEVKVKIRSLGIHTRFLKHLVAKSLIHIVPIDYGEYFGVKAIRKFVDMHDLIQEMGWRIVAKAAEGHIERYNRLWSEEHVNHILPTNKTVIVKAEHVAVEESWLGKSLVNALQGMNNLIFLEVYYSFVSKNFRCNVPSERLQWLCLNSYPSKHFPKYSSLSKLVCLKMQFNSLQHTPNFGNMPLLEILDLSCSFKLTDIDASIGTHRKLRNVNLSDCEKLVKFPRITKMNSLEILDLSATSLTSVPEIRKPHKLRKLNLSSVSSLISFPLPIGLGRGLQELNINSCKEMTTLAYSIFGLERLVILHIRECRLWYFGEGRYDHETRHRNKLLSKFLSLPRLKILDMADCKISELIIEERIEQLPPLQYLDLSSNDLLVNLPESISRFTCLKKLRLSDCNILETISKLPSSLTSLEMRSCIALRRMPDLLQLFDQNEDWSLLDLENCKLFATMPECHSAFCDEESMDKMLQKRKNMLQVFLPGNIEAPWFRDQEVGHRVDVTIDSLCPSNVRGFAVMTISSSPNNRLFKLRTPRNTMLAVEKQQAPRAFKKDKKMLHTGFLYIPIDDVINSSGNLTETSYSFKVLSSASKVQRWGFGVVYKRGDDRVAVRLTAQPPGENIYEPFGDEEELKKYLHSGILSVRINGVITSENCEKKAEDVHSSTSGSSDEPNQPSFDCITKSVSGEEDDSYSWSDWLEDSSFYKEELCVIM